ncbi:MAG: hypothetical protein M1133_14360 [Armatimonadetes bacterium]|nr:hypothetical protein [Armatimonadota bacterium]
MESGNLSNTPDKLEIIATIMSEIHYDAVGVGTYDLQLGDTFSQKTDGKLKVLDASPTAARSAAPYVIKRVDGVKVGIVSFGFVRPGQNDFAVRRSFYGAYKAAREGSDILILLDQGNWANNDWLARNGARFGAPDLVVGGTAKMGLQQEETVGRTHIVPTAYQGRYVGICDVDIVPGQEPKITSRRVLLDAAVPEDPVIAQRVKAAIYPNQGKVVLANNTASQQTNRSTQPPIAPGPYYPSLICRSCHSKYYDDWAASKHGKAIKTLVDEEKMVPECLACHSEKFRRTASNLIDTSGVGGVECASCHMNAIPHGNERINMTAKAKVSPTVCLTCHTKDRSPNYNETTYFSAVGHPSLKNIQTSANPAK